MGLEIQRDFSRIQKTKKFNEILQGKSFEKISRKNPFRADKI